MRRDPLKVSPESHPDLHRHHHHDHLALFTLPPCDGAQRRQAADP